MTGFCLALALLFIMLAGAARANENRTVMLHLFTVAHVWAAAGALSIAIRST